MRGARRYRLVPWQPGAGRSLYLHVTAGTIEARRADAGEVARLGAGDALALATAVPLALAAPAGDDGADLLCIDLPPRAA